MKRLLPLLALTLAATIEASPVTLYWDGNDPRERVTNYRLWKYDCIGRKWDPLLNCGTALQVTFDQPDWIAWYCLTAWNSYGQSDDISNILEVEFSTVRPASPTGLGLMQEAETGGGL